MSKRRYTRRDSGLLLADDSIAVPQSQPPKPWYAQGLLSSWRGMGRRRCCCGETCAYCIGSSTPQEIQVQLLGLVDACAVFNDTYVLTWNMDGYTPCGGCAWKYTMANDSILMFCHASLGNKSVAWWDPDDTAGVSTYRADSARNDCEYDGDLFNWNTGYSSTPCIGSKVGSYAYVTAL